MYYEIEPKPEIIETFETLLPRLTLLYGLDEVLVRRIISCESMNDPNALNKNINKEGIHWSSDYGYFQLNDYYHKEKALSLELDIYNWEDNLEYGSQLMNEKGTRPWSASKDCWE